MRKSKWPWPANRNKTTGCGTGKLIVLLLLLSFSFALQADDIEIYLSPPATPVPPNILFVIDESGAMQDGKLRKVMSALTADDGILGEDANLNINAAFMSFNSDTASETDDEDVETDRIRVLSDFKNLEDKNTRSKIASAVEALNSIGGSPIVNAISVAIAWFDNNIVESKVAAAKEYASPLKSRQDNAKESWCVPNAMVLLTAGTPDRSSSTTETRYRSIACDVTAPFSSAADQPGLCAQEIAEWAYQTDLMPEEAFPGWKGKQHVVTHTVGIQTAERSEAERFLQNIAYRGGGRYSQGQTASSATAAVKQIVDELSTSIPYSYTPPAIPYNPDRAAIDDGFIYVPVFNPEAGVFWKGNLLKYKTGSDEKGNRFIRDRSGKDVFSDDFLFNTGLQDYWLTDHDGDGGVSSKMTSATTRNLYSWLQGENRDLSDIPAGSSISPNRVHADNSRISSSMLGVINAGERLKLLNWVNWQDSPQDSEINKAVRGNPDAIGIMPMGAPLHSKPVVVNYKNENDLVLINTTDGILHAFNAGGDTAGGGEELWAFIPQQLLADLAHLKRNPPSSIPHYGLDGPLTVYETIDYGVTRKFAVFGMRRGGRSLFALDISNRTAPVMAWQIDAASSAGFDRLGQTWSAPQFLSMELNGSAARDVLVFGGGYDPLQDKQTTRTDDSFGNAVFVIDAVSGVRLAYFSANENADNSGFQLQIDSMKNGILGVLPVDINSNGISDRLYAADVAGRIFRIDIPDSSFSDTTISGGLIADINNSGEGFQRFFTAPEVAYYSRGSERFLAILIGSGFLPQPLNNTVTDRFYMIKDTAIWSAPKNTNGEIEYVSIDENDLYDASDNRIQDGSVSEINQSKTELSGSSGWYINLIAGGVKQKVFSKPRVFNSVISFTGFQGERSESGDRCTASSSMGKGSIYAIKLVDGTAVLDMNEDDTLDASDRSKTLPSSGIPPAAVVVSTDIEADRDKEDSDSPAIGPGNTLRLPNRFIPFSWEEVIDQYPPTRAQK